MAESDNVIGKLAVHYGNNVVIRALLQLIPNWGAADELLQQRANEIRSERLRTFFDELARGEKELTAEIIQSEDFLHFYFSTVRAAINTRQKEKIRLFARLLNSSSSPNIQTTADEFEEMLSVLEAITFREFSILLDLSILESKYPISDEKQELSTVLKYWKEFRLLCAERYKIHDGEFSGYMVRLERSGLYLRTQANLSTYKGVAGRSTEIFSRLLELLKERGTD